MARPEMKFIEANDKDTIDSIVAQITDDAKSYMIVLGDYDASLSPAIESLCTRAIVPAALKAGTTIIDNGASAGCASLMGQAAGDEEHGPRLIGIAPRGTEAPEPNHSAIVCLSAEWSDPLKALCQIVAELATRARREKPVVAVLFGGGKTETKVLLRCARRGWPVVLIQGSGGIADEILKTLASAPEGTSASPAADPDLREIIETADISQFSLSGNVDDLSRILLARLDLRIDTLIDSWSRFDDLDEAANNKQALFRNLQKVILSLGVLATFLAIVQSGNALNSVPEWLRLPLLKPLEPYKSYLQNLVHALLVLTPIAISVLVAANSRFREGNKWILLRASAEAIKREIFRYRMRAGAYRDDQCQSTSRESKLAAKLKDISSALSQSEVNRTSVPAVAKDDPARLTFLSPEDYLTDRIEEQVAYFVTKTSRLYKRLKVMQTWIYVVGGAGTFLAAFRGDVWVALTTAVAAALTARLEMDQIENTLVQYNQALTGLRNIVSWWNALSPWEKGRPRNIDLLVEQTEKTLEGELAGWVQQMQSALDKLTEKEQSAEEGDRARAAKATG